MQMSECGAATKHIYNISHISYELFGLENRHIETQSYSSSSHSVARDGAGNINRPSPYARESANARTPLLLIGCHNGIT